MSRRLWYDFCWVKHQNSHNRSSSTLFSFLQRFLQAFKFPKSSGGKPLRRHRSSERGNALWRWSVGCHTAQRGNKTTTPIKEEKREEAVTGDNLFTTFCLRRKPRFCHLLALFLNFCLMAQEAKVWLWYRNLDIQISFTVHKGFHRKIFKYFACGDFLLSNKSSPKMLQTFPVDRSSLFEVLAGPGPVCVPITLRVWKYA